MDHMELEETIYNAGVVMSKCFNRSRLPVSSYYGPVSYPSLTDGNCDSKTRNKQQTTALVNAGDSIEKFQDDNANTIHRESADHRETADSDDDNAETGLADGGICKRSLEDLIKYKQFFEYVTPLTDRDNQPGSCDIDPANHGLHKEVDDLLLADMETTLARHDEIKTHDTLATLELTMSERSSRKRRKKNYNIQEPQFAKPINSASACKSARDTRYANDYSLKRANEDWQPWDVSHVVSPSVTAISDGQQQGRDFFWTVDRENIHASAISHEPCSDADQMSDLDGLHLHGHDNFANKIDDPALYAELVANTRSIYSFTKLAYPDQHGHFNLSISEPFQKKNLIIQRLHGLQILQDIERFLYPDQLINKVVYDLDALLANETTAVVNSAEMKSLETSNQSMKQPLSNHDEILIASDATIGESESLKFESRFESGNLRKAVQIRQYEYDLVLSPDINTNHHHQWFYFQVSNMKANVPYRFNIINCEKINSQYNSGMRPVMYSVYEAMQGHMYWFRAGTKICYYKNHFSRNEPTDVVDENTSDRTYLTASFTFTFKHENDVCYIAYHYPYTYTLLQYHLKKWKMSRNIDLIYLRQQTLCQSLGGNDVPLLTITSPLNSRNVDDVDKLGELVSGFLSDKFETRPIIFLCSRVHPGESNSSWVMKGTIDFLLSRNSAAQALRDLFVFKIVPMLNPDGVINGNHRCSLIGEDLNRCWLSPCPRRHPTIYHTKALLQYLKMIGREPLVFCDYHGHSRRTNVFLYGCSPSHSWKMEDVHDPAFRNEDKTENTNYKILPSVLHSISPAFSLDACSYNVERSRESTARVVVWRQFHVISSYTMESSFCGCDQGPYKGCHMTTAHLEEMGSNFAKALIYAPPGLSSPDRSHSRQQ